MKNKKVLIAISTITFILFVLVYVYIQNKGSDCTPYNLQINNNDNQTNITWLSKSQCSSFIKYGTSLDNISKKITPVLYTSMLNTKYEVKVDKTDIEFFYLVINDENYYLNGKIISVD